MSAVSVKKEENKLDIEEHIEVYLPTEPPVFENQGSLKMSNIGNIEPFLFDGQSTLKEYLQRMEFCFQVQIEEDLKIAFLISSAGRDFHERVKVVIAPKELI